MMAFANPGTASTSAILLVAALAYARLGLPPVPMIIGSKRPALRGWRTAASRDPDRVRDAFIRARAADGVAIATGGGIFVLDLDRNHPGGENGIESVGAIARAHGDALPVSCRVRMPRGGVYLYARYGENVRVGNRVGLAPGIDFRGGGGLALAPPSDGYRWSPSILLLRPCLAPPWLLGLVCDLPPSLDPPAPARPYCGSASAWSRTALNAETAKVASAAPGTRNSTLFKAAAGLGSLVAGAELPRAEIEAELIAASMACGLVHDDGARAAAATIASGLRCGAASPRRAPAHGPTSHGQ